MARLQLEGVRKTFRNGRETVTAVERLDLTVEDGEFVVLLGPSGCGKTTTLRMVAGLERPSEGRILIGGRDVTGLPPKDRGVAMVFQDYALYPHMTVFDNMAFGLRNLGYREEEVRRRVTRAAEMLGLTDLLLRRPAQLSGGQRQRVALGRALVRDPHVFLFDEPLSNLDARLRVQMRAEIAQVHEQVGGTALFVTHDQTEALTLGTRIAVMHQGVVLQYDTPEGVYDRPANRFVANFVGTPPMNLLSAAVVSGADGLQLRRPGMAVPLGPEWRGKVGPGKEVIAGFRPEALSLAPKGDGAGEVRVLLRRLEILGNQVVAYGDMEGEEIAALVPRLHLARGEAVTLYLSASDLHLFDPVTEKRLGP